MFDSLQWVNPDIIEYGIELVFFNSPLLVNTFIIPVAAVSAGIFVISIIIRMIRG
jgi:hypothetical protein